MNIGIEKLEKLEFLMVNKEAFLISEKAIVYLADLIEWKFVFYIVIFDSIGFIPYSENERLLNWFP